MPHESIITEHFIESLDNLESVNPGAIKSLGTKGKLNFSE